MSIVKSHMLNVSFVFFGTPEPAVEILENLKKAGMTASLVMTNSDQPRGRKMALTPPPVKLWAIANGIPFLQPENLKEESFLKKLRASRQALFIVVAYGKIIPKEILTIPEKGVLNVHYSLLPKYRGASPIESQILNDDKDVGVTIMLLDEKMDHGPIVAQRELQITNHNNQITNKSQIQNSNTQTPIKLKWPPSAAELRDASNELAGKLLAETIPLWLEGKIRPEPQDHSQATYSRKITGEDCLIDLTGDPYKNFLKIQALNERGVYFLAERSGKKIRVLVKRAEYKDGALILKKVLPEGKRQMSWGDFLKGNRVA